MIACALVVVGLLMAAVTVGGAVMGGAHQPSATTCRAVRAPPIEHWSSIDEYCAVPACTWRERLPLPVSDTLGR